MNEATTHTGAVPGFDQITISFAELRQAPLSELSTHTGDLMDELMALSTGDQPCSWVRAVDGDELTGGCAGWLWVMYADGSGSGLYLRVLTDAPLWWADLPDEAAKPLTDHILTGLQGLPVYTPFGTAGHA